ncbi:hypothetical protein GCM10022225_05720 [Plantactinospora mayteni]|uniref:Uncharacterized protein n=1 Tax=Plantactinospora mayteni TaxID=566021 RepID=A0ABQ4EQZ6_9ACTN|nr:DUF6232 family protein [Plantactinospora mayteni]GIG97061.1 hypothetical protein Pma05_36340 [Plantactinospora mayteni]
MTLYYRDDTVRVTSETIHVNGRSVPVAEVSYVWHARGRGTARTRGRLAGRGVLIFLLSIPPLVAVVCVLSLAYSAQDRGEWRLAAIILAVCVVGALALIPFLEVPLYWLDRSYERGAKVQELWVQYRGEEVILLRSSDALRFGQIYRAIQRAIEQHSPER